MRFARDCTGIACSRVMNIKAVWPITVLVSKRKKKKKRKEKEKEKRERKKEKEKRLVSLLYEIVLFLAEILT